MAAVEDVNAKIQYSQEDCMRFAVMGESTVLAGLATEYRRRSRNCVVGLATVCLMLTLTGMPARAASRFSPEEVAACKALSEQAANLIRAGQTVMTTRAQLRHCVRVQRAERRRAGRPADAGRN